MPTKQNTVFDKIIHHLVMYVKNFTSLNDIFSIMSYAKQIGNNLKEARRYKGLTQKNIAEKLCMTQQQYSRFENGVFELNYMQIITLCKLLDITPNELFEVNE